jgi:hypothetical protein
MSRDVHRSHPYSHSRRKQQRCSTHSGHRRRLEPIGAQRYTLASMRRRCGARTTLYYGTNTTLRCGSSTTLRCGTSTTLRCGAISTRRCHHPLYILSWQFLQDRPRSTRDPTTNVTRLCATPPNQDGERLSTTIQRSVFMNTEVARVKRMRCMCVCVRVCV